jgi:hypothetical protein
MKICQLVQELLGKKGKLKITSNYLLYHILLCLMESDI